MSFDTVEDLAPLCLNYSQALFDKKKLVFAHSVLVADMRKSGANVFCEYT